METKETEKAVGLLRWGSLRVKRGYAVRRVLTHEPGLAGSGVDNLDGDGLSCGIKVVNRRS
ncbi:MAG: hypothetical protein LBS58_03945 [Coriobacteriales bacterium]|nr:hypothetical protein [Coriobacteriales bacterium]